jgi:hypothetical protein
MITESFTQNYETTVFFQTSDPGNCLVFAEETVRGVIGMEVFTSGTPF